MYYIVLLQQIDILFWQHNNDDTKWQSESKTATTKLLTINAYDFDYNNNKAIQRNCSEVASVLFKIKSTNKENLKFTLVLIFSDIHSMMIWYDQLALWIIYFIYHRLTVSDDDTFIFDFHFILIDLIIKIWRGGWLSLYLIFISP